MIESFQERVRVAAQERRPLRLRGAGTKDFYGEPPTGTVLDTRDYSGIVDYEPTELVITARCGTPLADIEAALAEHHQMLAFEPPHFGAGATLGGAVATGLSGPRRAAAGSLRDFVLGAQLLDGRAQVLNFGGKVMKNVAGYDVARALAGSLGTLGMILEVSLKVLPRPMAGVTLQFDMSETEALHQLNRWAGQPLPVTASAWTGGTLGIRLEGAEAAVDAACVKLGGRQIDATQAARFWTELREHVLPFFAASDVPLWRLSVPSAAAPLDLPGEQLIEWGGALRWLRSTAPAATLRETARAAGGHATLFRSVEALRASVGVFQPLEPAVAAIQRRLTAEFDPQGIFNPGRLYAAPGN